MSYNIIFRDPVFDGAADPTVIRRESDGLYFMFYTQRRATLECAGVEWAHGTKIGVAVCEKAFEEASLPPSEEGGGIRGAAEDDGGRDNDDFPFTQTSCRRRESDGSTSCGTTPVQNAHQRYLSLSLDGADAPSRQLCPFAVPESRAGDESPLRLFDRGTSSPSLVPPQAAVGLVTPQREPSAGGWRYAGTAELPFVEGKTTYWAPEVIFDGENYRMFVSSVDGVYADWSGSAEILQFVSPDLMKWSPVFSQTNYTERHPERSDAEHRAVEGSPGFSERSEREGDFSDVVLGMTDTSSAPSGHLLLEGKAYKSCAIPIDSPRVIDACAFPLPSGGWRLWYKDEKRGSHTYYIDTFDFREWRPGGEATSDTDQEGPNVFEFGGRYWLIADVWDGLAVYASDDLTRFTRQEGNLLPGAASHADVFVEDGRAWLVYFTYPEGDRRSAVCVRELKAEGGRLCVSMSS